MTADTTPADSDTDLAPDRQVRRTAVVTATPAAVFALLTDPAEHVRLDGSGTVQAVLEAPRRLHLGAEFRMQMKGYRTLNRVVEHHDDELIAWRHRGRHVWRWELRPVAGGTEVTATFDHRAKRLPSVVRALGIAARAGAALDRSLVLLQQRVG